MTSDEEINNQKSGSDRKEKRFKKGTASPKSSKPSKSKKSSFIIKKLKLKSKSVSDTNSPSVSGAEGAAVPSKDFEGTSVLERQTPEGDDNFILTKSASETNLKEKLPEDKGEAESGSAGTSEKEQVAQQKIYPDRTKSLENLKDMLTYGELILDKSAETSNTNQIVNKPKDHLYKILVIGDLGTGKTSIIKRYVHRFFTQHYRATIGVDFALKVLNWDDNTLVRLQLWDIAGQERYGNMTRVYYKEAVGAFIVFDVTRRNTFESVANWKADLDSKVQLPDGSPIPCVLLANKCDQPKEGIANVPTKMDEYCKENGFTTWLETSAKDNINIDEAARALVEKILECDTIINNDAKKSVDQFSISKSNNQGNSKSCPC